MIHAWALQHTEDPERFLAELTQPLPNRRPTQDAAAASLEAFDAFTAGR